MKRNNKQPTSIQTKNFYDLLDEDNVKTPVVKPVAVNSGAKQSAARPVVAVKNESAPVVPKDLAYYRQFMDKQWYDIC